MTVSFWFWVIYVVGFIFGVYRQRAGIVDDLFWWVLVGLLGYGVFASPIK